VDIEPREVVMAALVVTVSPANGLGRADARIGIFPGGAIPSVFPAGTPFWIGYGFAPEQDDGPGMRRELGPDTRFELDVDGTSADVRTSVRKGGGSAQGRKTDIAEFPSGLPAGWHDFTGRWYDGGTLVLSSRASIEFVEG
jgi:hypothetical protein